jgi:hypothetical protein
MIPLKIDTSGNNSTHAQHQHYATIEEISSLLYLAIICFSGLELLAFALRKQNAPVESHQGIGQGYNQV